MTKKAKDIKNLINKILEDNAELFEGLSDALLCPSCKKIIRGVKYNLGEEFNWFEGCKDCYDKTERLRD